MLRQLLAPKQRSSSDERGFTVLELMVVVVIIALLATGLSLFIGNQRSLAVDAQTTSDIRNAANALERWQATSITNKVASSTDVTSNDNTFGIVVTPGTNLKVNPGPVAFSYTVCGYNPAGSAYKAADTSTTYSSYNGGLSTKAGPCVTSAQPGGDGGTVTPPVTPVDKEWQVGTSANYDWSNFNPPLSYPTVSGVTQDSNGTSYITYNASSQGNKIYGLAKIDANNKVINIVSSLQDYFPKDGAPGTATLNVLRALTVGSDGNIYFSSGNALRKATLTGTVTTIVSQMTPSSVNDTLRMASDRNGLIYIINSGAIYKVDTSAPKPTSTLFVGGSYGSTDGTGADAKFLLLGGMVVAPSGNLYIADGKLIRQVTPAGVVTTIMGNSNSPNPPNDGAGNLATFARAQAISITPNGNLYVYDTNTIRQIDTANVVKTIAGKYSFTATTDGPGSIARFASFSGDLFFVKSDTNFVFGNRTLTY